MALALKLMSKQRNPLHYNWCGLEGVYLRSGFERIKTK